MSELYEKALQSVRAGESTNTVISLLNQAADGGEKRASYALASWYLHGTNGLPQDKNKAFLILSELSDSNIAEAAFDLAFMYDVGDVIEGDESKAFSLYMRAALLGDAESCLQIAEFYREGSLVDCDDQLAKAWSERAACDEREISPPYRLWLT